MATSLRKPRLSCKFRDSTSKVSTSLQLCSSPKTLRCLPRNCRYFISRKSNSVKTSQLYIHPLYQISYILVKENVIKSDKISLKFMQKRITFVFTECYKHFAKKNTQKPGFNHLTLRFSNSNRLFFLVFLLGTTIIASLALGICAFLRLALGLFRLLACCAFGFF